MHQNWRALPAQRRNELRQENHELFGRDLTLLIHRVTEETRKSRVVRKLCAAGHLKDKIDLDTKYKNKTEQLENIYANAYTILCPIRKVHLWADPEFTTHVELEESEEFATRIGYKNEQVKKRQKTAPKAKAKDGETKAEIEDGGDDANEKYDFDDGQIEKITQSQGEIDELQSGTLKAKIDEVQELAEFLPNMYVAMASGLLTQFSEDSAVVKAIIAEKKSGCESNGNNERTSRKKEMDQTENQGHGLPSQGRTSRQD